MKPLSGHTIGFIGLGMMGRPMAINLHNAGANLIIHNRSQIVVKELASRGMTAAESPADVARQAPITICILPDSPTVENIITGDNGIVSGLQTGGLVIDMSTCKVPDTRRWAAEVKQAGGDYIDAPVSGGTIGAEQGSLSIMAGGSQTAMDQAMPLFDVLGAKTTHVGDVGAGQIAKAANQVIVGLNIGAVAEALTLAKQAGADPAKVCEALKGGFADSRVLEVHGQRMVNDRFPPGAKSTIQRKDMDQAIELAAELGFTLPATSLSRDLYDKLIADGHGDLDHAALIKVIEPE